MHLRMIKLHYKEFIAENHYHYIIHIYDIHFIFKKKHNYQLQLLHYDCHSSVSWLFKFFHYVPSDRPAHEKQSKRQYICYTITITILIFLHCYKTECWIPLHSMHVSRLKSSWHGKCFLLLDRVNTCSRMDSSNHNGKLHWRILTQTGIFHWLSFPKMEFSNDSS